MSFTKELTALPQWICWRLEPDPKGEKPRKVPYDPKTGRKASSTNPQTWATLPEAEAARDRYQFTGLGFVFTENCGIVGVDIDHCRAEDGTLSDTARAILDKFPSYTEISPSGTGLHIFYHGAMPGKGNKNSATGVEMYSTGRYFTMTGQHLEGTPEEIAADADALSWIHEAFVAKKRKEKALRPARQPARLTDEVVLEKARASANGEDFADLWEGRWKDKYGSQSEADLALCCALAFWTGKEATQMDRLFRQSALLREKWDNVHHADGSTYGAETIRQAIERTEQTYSPEGEPAIREQSGRYYRVKGEQVYPITNFIIQPLDMVESEDEARMTCDIVTITGETYRQTFMSADFSNVQKFKGVLNKRTIALCYTGSDGDLEMLKGYVATLPWERKKGISHNGFLQRDGKWIFVNGDNALGADGMPLSDIVQPERYVSLETALLDARPITAEGLRELGLPLLRYNESAKTVTVLAWCAGCFLKEHMHLARIKYPHLFLIGEAGSGKSNTLERVILPIFARSKINASTQVTAFTLMKESASSNCIPQALDEFKPSKIEKLRLNALYNHMRDSYDGHAGLRGRADQSQVSYDLLAPLVVAGEESPNESAVRERSLELLFAKRDIKDAETRAAFLRISMMQDTLASFGRGLLETALTVSSEEATAWYAEAIEMFSKALASRIVTNLSVAMAGLRLIERLCHRLGLQWGQVFPISLDECAKFMSYGVHEYLLDGGESNKTVVEHTLEVFDRMKLGPELVHLSNDGKELGLYVKDIYDLFTQYVKDHAVDGERLTRTEFIKQLKRTEYYLGTKAIRFGDRVKEGHVLNYPMLAARCDVSGFGDVTPPLCKV